MVNAPKEKNSLVERYNKLKNAIERHNRLYHTKDSPEISDEAYDSLTRELASLEKKYPGLKSKDTPTERVGDKLREGFKKVRHKIRQYSFDNVFSFEELKDWEDKVKRMTKKAGFNAEELSYTAELKIDGLKIILTYKKGKYTQATTRGDGVIGEDVTQNVKTIEDIVKQQMGKLQHELKGLLLFFINNKGFGLKDVELEYTQVTKQG